MKNILLILLLFVSCAGFGQTYGYMISKDPTQHADTSNIGIMYPTGHANLTGRMHFVSYETLAANLSEFIGSDVDSIYINDGDSLVIIMRDDTIYFEGGGGVSDGNFFEDNLVSDQDVTHDQNGNDVVVKDIGSGKWVLAKNTGALVDNPSMTYKADSFYILQANGDLSNINTLLIDNTGGVFNHGITLSTEYDNSSETSQVAITSKGITLAHGDDSGGDASIFIDYGESGSIILDSEQGEYKLNTLPPSGSSTDSVLMINPTTKLITLKDQSSFGSDGNFATRDLTADGERYHDFAGNALQIDEVSYLDLNTQEGGATTLTHTTPLGSSQIYSNDDGIKANHNNNSFIYLDDNRIDFYNIDSTYRFIASPMRDMGDATDVMLLDSVSGVWYRKPITDLSGSVDDRSFYDYGTTDMPTVSSDSIETTNVKYVLFNGLDGGLPTKIEMLKEGTIQFDKTGLYNDPTWLIKANPLQTGVGSPSFGIVQFAGDNLSGTRKNDTYSFGINPSNLESGTALYFSFEGHYQPTATDGYHEMHLVMKDSADVERRVWTWFLDKETPDNWAAANYLQAFDIRDPNSISSDGTYFKVKRNDNDESEIRLLGSGGSTGGGSDGVLMKVNRADNSFILSPYGSMPSTAAISMDQFDFAYTNKLYSHATSTSSYHYSIIKNDAAYTTSNKARLALAPHSGYTVSVSPYIEAYNDTGDASSGVDGGLRFGTYNSGLIESFRIAPNGSLRAAQYDATPPTGTPFGLLAHESDGDIISYDPALKVSVSDTTAMLLGYVRNSTNETIADVKTFTSDPIIPDEAYGSGWDGVLEPPTKNAVYDKIETLGGTVAPTTISPSQITSDQDNYNPTGMGKATYVRISGDNGIRAITGIADSTAGTLEKTLLNIGSFAMYLPMDHPDSDAAHRFTGYKSDYIIYPGKSVKILYDLTSTKWRILSDYAEGQNETNYYSQSAASVTAADHPSLGFQAIGTGTNTATSATTTFPAHYLMSTATNAAWGYILYLADGVSQISSYGTSHAFAEATISLPVLSDGSETYTTELQFHPSPTTQSLEANNTIGIRYSHGVNSGKWQLFVQDNGGSEGTPTDLAVTVAANTSYRLRLEVDKTNSETRAYINGVFCGRLAAGMPNAAIYGARVVHMKSVGTTARTCQVYNISAGSIYP